MKFFIALISIAILSFFAGRYFSWWSIAVVAFVISVFIVQKPMASFLSGFLAIFLFWLVMALIINAANGGILANRIGAMLGIGQNPILLACITSLVGGLVAGFAAMTASFLRKNKP